MRMDVGIRIGVFLSGPIAAYQQRFVVVNVAAEEAIERLTRPLLRLPSL